MLTLTPTQPRERLQRLGIHQLSLEQAVSLILGTGTFQKPVEVMSCQASQLLRSGADRVDQLMQIKGLGLAKASALVAALYLPTMLNTQGESLLRPLDVFAACHDLLNESQEHLVVFYLNIRNNSLVRETISIGTATQSLCHPREVFRAAIVHNAQRIILAHNHPSGDPQPSAADLAVTKELARAGSVVGIELVDHVICAKQGFVSLKEQVPAAFP